jgi:hypothetical protein
MMDWGTRLQAPANRFHYVSGDPPPLRTRPYSNPTPGPIPDESCHFVQRHLVPHNSIPARQEVFKRELKFIKAARCRDYNNSLLSETHFSPEHTLRVTNKSYCADSVLPKDLRTINCILVRIPGPLFGPDYVVGNTRLLKQSTHYRHRPFVLSSQARANENRYGLPVFVKPCCELATLVRLFVRYGIRASIFGRINIRPEHDNCLRWRTWEALHGVRRFERPRKQPGKGLPGQQKKA